MEIIYNFKFFKKKNHRAVALGLIIFTASQISVKAQVNAYSFTQSLTTYETVSGGTVLGTATANTGAASLYNVSYSTAMPFTFNFNGENFNNLKVSSNGYISFGGTDDPTGSSPISGDMNWKGAVSAWGRSLNSMFNINNTTGDIKYETVGVAPNREFVIQWNNFKPSYSTSTTSVYAFSFQVRLRETSNTITTKYNSGSFLIGSTTVASTAQIGLRGASDIDYHNRLNLSTNSFTNSTLGTANTSTQYYSTASTAASGMPPAGLTYTWTPPSCFAPVLTTGDSTSNSIIANWSAPLPSPSNYEIYYSTSNTAPTNTTAPSPATISGSTATINALASSTLYYVWVRSNCGMGNLSNWSTKPLILVTKCQPPALLGTTGETVCPGNSAILNATVENGGTINWYDTSTGGNLLATGNSYSTPSLTSTTNYWVSTSRSNVGNVGLPAPISTSGNTGVGIGLTIDAYKSLTINTVDIYPYTTTSANAGTGTVTVNLVNSAGTILHTNTFTVNVAYQATAAILNTLPLNYSIPAGSGYKLLISAKSSSVSGFIRESSTSAFSFPYVLADVCSLGTTTSGYYYYLYNLNISSNCESDRTQITATVDNACLGTAETKLAEKLVLYPNPFINILNIDNPSLIKSLQVLDPSGKLIKTLNAPKSSLQLDDLPSGVYLIILNMNDGSKQSSKVIKK